jgi:pimeloyl-ACP methyl ester carboxylesterase
MGDFEQVSVTLQSGSDVRIDAWPGPETAQAVVIVAPGTTADDWSQFASNLVLSHVPVLAHVSSYYELILLIWKIGEPVLLVSQGEEAAHWVARTMSSALGAVSKIVICDGDIPSDQVESVPVVSTLVLRGRQSTLMSHTTAVLLHERLVQSMLVELEHCSDFPANDNPTSAAAAVNMFITRSGSSDDYDPAQEPVDPKSFKSTPSVRSMTS